MRSLFKDGAVADGASQGDASGCCATASFTRREDTVLGYWLSMLHSHRERDMRIAATPVVSAS